jgi:hypothetical protein
MNVNCLLIILLYLSLIKSKKPLFVHGSFTRNNYRIIRKLIMTCILTSSREQNYRIHITNNWFNKLIFMLLLKTFYFTKAPTCGMLVQHFNKR